MYLISILSVILNRWRGTGVLINFGSFSIGWSWFTKLYNKFKKTEVVNVTFYPGLTGALVYALFFGFMYYLVTSDIYLAILGVGLFILAESMGWGEWIGSLCYPEEMTPEKLEFCIKDDEGKGFPYTHYIANFFVKEAENHYRYSQIALTIRGLWFGLIVYSAFAYLNYISLTEYIALSATWAIGFPLACRLSRVKTLWYSNRFISMQDKWETQEVYYGVIHAICNGYLLYNCL